MIYMTIDHVGVVMEHMSRGSLQAVIHDAKVSWDWDTMLQLLIDGAQVLPTILPNICTRSI